MKYLFILASLLLTQCNVDDNQIICTDVFAYGLNVTVKDATTNESIITDIIVIAKDGEYEEELMQIEGFDQFVGAGERPGNYIIEITSPNYQTFISEVVSVGADECHVIAEVVEFSIQPN